MGARRRYTWFLYPLSDQTNEAISREVPEVNFRRDVLCADGKLRNVWECPFDIVMAFWTSRNNHVFQFRVFVQTKGGKIRDVTLLLKKWGRKSTAQFIR